MLEFSSTLSSTRSPYLYISNVHTANNMQTGVFTAVHFGLLHIQQLIASWDILQLTSLFSTQLSAVNVSVTFSYILGVANPYMLSLFKKTINLLCHCSITL